MSRSICTGGRFGGCGRVFSSVSAFDRYRTGQFAGTRGRATRRCMTEAEMLRAGMVVHPTKTHVWTLEASLHGWERIAERKAG